MKTPFCKTKLECVFLFGLLLIGVVELNFLIKGKHFHNTKLFLCMQYRFCQSPCTLLFNQFLTSEDSKIAPMVKIHPFLDIQLHDFPSNHSSSSPSFPSQPETLNHFLPYGDPAIVVFLMDSCTGYTCLEHE